MTQTKLDLTSESQKPLSFVQFINYGEDDQMEICGYKLCRIKQISTWLSIIVTIGLLRLVFYWKPDWMLYCTHTRCDLEYSTKVLLTDKYDQTFVEDVNSCENSNLLLPMSNGNFKTVKHVRVLNNKKCRYFWSVEQKRFVKLVGLDFGTIQCNTLHNHGGLSKEDWSKRLSLFGTNLIEISVQSVVRIFFVEVLNPFYIYQFFAMIFWSADHYFYYASYILIMSIISLSINTYQIKVNQKRLRDKVYGCTDVLVCRPNGKIETINSSDLVPGDVITLENQKFQLYCDAVLLSGEVIVDESMLTGESNPVTKTPLRNNSDLYHHKKDSKHILYCGTSIIQARKYANQLVRAVVIRTNFQTAKGELVRSILFPKPIDFKFNRHINHFLFVMSFLAMIGFIYTVVIKINRHDGIGEIIFKALDLITIVVPPELPAALTIATIFVEKRLRRQKIYCMSPRSINISGCVDCVVFDKTGTLTENDVDLEEVLEVNEYNRNFNKPLKEIDQLASHNRLCQCLAVCHSLKILDEKFIGENLETMLFNSTNWDLHELDDSIERYGFPVLSIVSDPNSEVSLGVIKQHPFTSKTARMSVVVKNLNSSQNGVQFYIKGAPEIIVAHCIPESIPGDFAQVLNDYTQKSYRVLAVAYKEFPNLTVEEAISYEVNYYEQDLTFLGLIVMRNKLKSSTLDTIQTLNNANFRLIMATGDNLMTALSVAKECDIVYDSDSIVIIETEEQKNPQNKPKLKWSKHCCKDKLKNYSCSVTVDSDDNYKIAMTGNTFKVLRKYYPELLCKIIVRCSVYARMAPEQKQQLVELLQSVGYYVSMCGDGANDCGALKVAHAGVSLSDTEASVASSFTCLTGEISCIVDMLREGRASLVSVFGIVRYMACYNITTFLAICILYYYYSALTDIQNLYQDVAIISIYVFLFGRTYPHKKLSPIRPPTSLIGLTQFSSIIIQLTLVAITQFTAVTYLHAQPWFKYHKEIPVDNAEDKNYECHDNYALFIIQAFQYVTLVIVFSKSAPYRRPIYKNKLLSLAIVVTSLITLFIVLTPEWPFEGLATFFGFEYKGFTFRFRLELVGLNIIHFIIAWFAEKLIVEKFVSKIERKYTIQPYEKFYKQTATLDWIPT